MHAKISDNNLHALPYSTERFAHRYLRNQPSIHRARLSFTSIDSHRCNPSHHYIIMSPEFRSPRVCARWAEHVPLPTYIICTPWEMAAAAMRVNCKCPVQLPAHTFRRSPLRERAADDNDNQRMGRQLALALRPDTLSGVICWIASQRRGFVRTGQCMRDSSLCYYFSLCVWPAGCCGG